MTKQKKITALFLAGCILVASPYTVLAEDSAHAHIGHVVEAWADTPNGMGFLPTAQKEALVAAAHASYSAKALDDLAEMQLHSTHVRHALDPALETDGPGLGYGMIKASEGMIKHITLAAESEDASGNVKTHTEHVVSATTNAIARAKLALKEAEAILAATTAEEAAPHAQKMFDLADAAIMGRDTNGDGKVTWETDEGGLRVAKDHMELMLKGEGLN